MPIALLRRRAPVVLVALATLAAARERAGAEPARVEPARAARGVAVATATDSASTAVELRQVLARTPPSGVGRLVWERAGRLYPAADGGPLWVSPDGRLAVRGRALADALARAGEEGLRPADYPLVALTAALADALRAPGPRTVAHADALCSAAFAAYGADLLTGRLDPRRIDSAWHVDPQAVNVDSALAATAAALAAAPDGATLARQLRPRAEGYEALVAALAEYRAFAAAGGWAPLAGGASLSPGDTSARVPALRRRLAAERWVDAARAADTARRYDPALAGAVARFQVRHGLEADSVVGPATRRALDVPAERRARQIAASLERLRWLPPRLGERYVVVNIPAFRLDAYEAGARVLTMPVVVGADYSGRATPILADTMRYVVLNPYWNVPGSIAERELWPHQRRDPGYLATGPARAAAAAGSASPQARDLGEE